MRRRNRGRRDEGNAEREQQRHRDSAESNRRGDEREEAHTRRERIGLFGVDVSRERVREGRRDEHGRWEESGGRSQEDVRRGARRRSFLARRRRRRTCTKNTKRSHESDDGKEEEEEMRVRYRRQEDAVRPKQIVAGAFELFVALSISEAEKMTTEYESLDVFSSAIKRVGGGDKANAPLAKDEEDALLERFKIEGRANPMEELERVKQHEIHEVASRAANRNQLLLQMSRHGRNCAG